MNEIKVVAAVIKKNNKYLLARKKKTKSNGGLWEFPGGKIRSGESLFAAVIREIFEELGMAVTPLETVGSVKICKDPNNTMRLFAVLCETAEDVRLMEDHDKVLWCEKEEMSALEYAPADVLLLELLEDHL